MPILAACYRVANNIVDMKLNKTNLVIFLVGIFLGLCTGFFSGKAIYDRPFDTNIKRDTVTLHDTVPDVAPVPKDSVRIKWLTKWLPAKHDTITQWKTLTKHDSVAVQVPITSKHYGNDTYDAWVSGFDPNLDSIRVYQKTQIITETITKVVGDNKHFFFDVGGGCEYQPNTKTAIPFAELGLSFRNGRFGAGAYGGYSHDLNENKATPYGKIKITYNIISF